MLAHHKCVISGGNGAKQFSYSRSRPSGAGPQPFSNGACGRVEHTSPSSVRPIRRLYMSYVYDIAFVTPPESSLNVTPVSRPFNPRRGWPSVTAPPDADGKSPPGDGVVPSEDPLRILPVATAAMERVVDLGPHYLQLSKSGRRQAREDGLDVLYLQSWVNMLSDCRVVGLDSPLGRDLAVLAST